MKERYIVRVTEEALDDMNKIYEYIAYELLSPDNAMNQYSRIADAILTLEYFPERYKLFETEPERSWNLRRMIVDNYIVCYLVDSDFVVVTDVLYGASDIHRRVIEKHS